jgi:hypothetical protein
MCHVLSSALLLLTTYSTSYVLYQQMIVQCQVEILHCKMSGAAYLVAFTNIDLLVISYLYILNERVTASQWRLGEAQTCE